MKKLILIVFLAACAAAGWHAWHQIDRSAADAGIRLYGNVDIRQVSLAFEQNGRILELMAEEGDSVKRGQLLARMDVKALELQANRLDAEIAAQEQNLLKLRNGPRQEDIARAKAALETALAAQEQAARNEQRMARLRRQNSISQQDLENAQTQLRVNTGQAEQARQALALLMAGSRTEDIAMAEAQLDAARTSLALLRHSISQGELRALTDAVVSSRLLEPGDMASPSSPVFLLSLTTPKWIRAYVTETQLGRVRPGMAANITTDSFPEPIPGKVGFISPTAEFTPKSVQTEELRASLLYEVRIIAEDDKDVLRLGMPATVELLEQNGSSRE